MTKNKRDGLIVDPGYILPIDDGDRVYTRSEMYVTQSGHSTFECAECPGQMNDNMRVVMTQFSVNLGEYVYCPRCGEKIVIDALELVGSINIENKKIYPETDE